MKYVDEGFIGAPFEVTSEILDSLNISIVVSGSIGHEEAAYKVTDVVCV